MAMTKLELTITADPEFPEQLREVARELAAGLPAEKHRVLLELARAMCRQAGDLADLDLILPG